MFNLRKYNYRLGLETLVVYTVKNDNKSNFIIYLKSILAIMKFNRIGGNIFNGGICDLIR